MSTNPNNPAYSGDTNATKDIHLNPNYDSNTLSAANQSPNESVRPPAPVFKKLNDKWEKDNGSAYNGA